MKIKEFDKYILMILFMSNIISLGHADNVNSNIQVQDLYKRDKITSPDLSQLIKNIKFPVNYSTGTVDIKIPLYTFKCGSLELPIYLTYNTAGVKVNDTPGWVGQGWELHAEPTLARNAMGHIDPNLTFSFEQDRINDYSRQGSYMQQIVTGNIFDGADSQPDQFYYRLPDTEGMFVYAQKPDNTYGFISRPYNDVKVSLSQSGIKYFILRDNKGNIYNFDYGSDNRSDNQGCYTVGWKATSIKSADGIDSIVFNYEKNSTGGTSYINHIDNFILQKDFYTESGEQLHQALASNFFEAQVLQDQYANDEHVSYPIESFLKKPCTKEIIDDKINYYKIDSCKLSYDTYQNNDTYLTQKNVTTTTHYLSSINYKGNKILFTHDSGSNQDRLMSIKVIDSLGTVVKEIHFKYLEKYNWQERNFLSEISLLSGRDSINYVFTYNHPEKMPDTGDCNQDFWGYYNGDHYYTYKTNNSLIPKMLVYYSNSENPQLLDSLTIGNDDLYSRAADSSFMSYGSLISITYPTGAKDAYTYEPNQIKLKVSGSHNTDERFHMSEHLYSVPGKTDIYYAGGLRIKQICSIAKDGECNFRTFRYNDDGSGESPINNDYNYFISENEEWLPVSHLGAYNRATGQNEFSYYTFMTCTSQTYSWQPFLPITYSNGSSVMYKSVIEYDGTPEDNTGYTQYIFDVPGNEYNNGVNESSYNSWDAHFDTHIYDSKYYGNLLEKNSFRKTDNNNYELVETVENKYNNGSENNIGKIVMGQYFAKRVFDGDYRDLAEYSQDQNLNSADFLRASYDGYAFEKPIIKNILSSSIVTKYFNNSSSCIKTETGYEYGHLLEMSPTSKVINRTVGNANSTDNEYLIENYKYPSDYCSLPYTDMVAKNILSLPICIEDSIKSVQADKALVISEEGNFENVNVEGSNPVYRETSTSYTYRNLKDGKVKESRMNYKYNALGEMVEACKDNDEVETYLYGYNNQYLIAEIQNATYNQVQNILTETKIKNIGKSMFFDRALYDLYSSLKDATVKLYQYKPLIGVTNIISPNSTVIRYNYDGFGRLSGKDYIDNYSKLNNSNLTFFPIEKYYYHYKTMK